MTDRPPPPVSLVNLPNALTVLRLILVPVFVVLGLQSKSWTALWAAFVVFAGALFYFDAVTWFGILAPAGTPAPIVAQLNKAINAALKVPDVAEKLRSEGGDVLGGTPEQFDQLLRAEVPRWGKIVKASGASLD